MTSFEVLEDEHDRPSIAVFDGNIPTIDEMRLVCRKALEARLVNIPAQHRGLNFLLKLRPYVRKLGIADALVTDASVVAKLSDLRELDLEVDQRVPVDLSTLPRLESFSGNLRNFESALVLPSLKHLYLRSVARGRLAPVEAPLRTLEMIDVGALDRLPVLSHPLLLRSLSLQGVKSLSLRGISRLEKLKTLEIAECKNLRDVDELTSLRPKVIYLEKVAHIDNPSLLLDLRARRVVVTGRNPFTSAFRNDASRTSVEWSYFGSARQPPS